MASLVRSQKCEQTTSEQSSRSISTEGSHGAGRAAFPQAVGCRGDGLCLIELAREAETGFGAYAASKGGLASLMKVLPARPRPMSVPMRSLPELSTPHFSPAALGEAASAARAAITSQRWANGARILASIPLGRIAEPEEVAAPMLFLSGPASSYITGHIFHINGDDLLHSRHKFSNLHERVRPAMQMRVHPGPCRLCERFETRCSSALRLRATWRRRWHRVANLPSNIYL